MFEWDDPSPPLQPVAPFARNAHPATVQLSLHRRRATLPYKPPTGRPLQAGAPNLPARATFGIKRSSFLYL